MKLRIWMMRLGVCLAMGGASTGFAASYTNEPAPNGGRVNVGLYGGTAEASKSRTNDWLFAMSFNDGGNLMQTGRLEWVASTNFTGKQVFLQFSTNNAVTWSNIATLAATNESYSWVPATSHPAVLWRVVSTNLDVASTNAKPFSIRTTTNATFKFYVNDGSTINDVYCSAVGSSNSLGVASNAPKASLMGIIASYSLRGGDIVYVDTGEYIGQEPVVIGSFDSGTAGNPVQIIGSTAGTVINNLGNKTRNVMDLSGASNLQIKNLKLRGGANGLSGGVSDIQLSNIQSIDNRYGFSIAGTGHVFENCLAADNEFQAFSGSGSGENRWLNGVMWNSPTLVHATSNKTLSVSNSILVGNGPSAKLFGSQVVPGDYNLVWNTSVGAGHSTFTVFQNAGSWTNSLYADPQFLNPNAPGYDFHLLSASGYLSNGVWKTNAAMGHSPAIDLGDPLSMAYANEPSPNGTRLNAGLFGGTGEASKSRTNAWIQLASYMDGGTLDAQAGAWVRWNAGGFDPGARVTIYISRDGGGHWEALVTNVLAVAGAYHYQELIPDDTSSQSSRLRVELEAVNPPASSDSPTNFIYRNGTFSFYVNDNYSPENDVYCTAAGDDANTGTVRGAPMRNLHALLEKYGGMGPGDRIYVDTGIYTATNAVKLTPAFSGTTNHLVTIVGSTNRQAGGSVFRSGTARPLGFDFSQGASNIVVRDIVLANVVRGVAIWNTVNVLLDGVEVRGASTAAFELQGNLTRNLELIRCVAHGGAGGIYLNQVTNATIHQSVFWQNTAYALSMAMPVGARVENSILASSQLNAVLISSASANLSGFSSDYNGIHAGPLTRVGSCSGALADNLFAWQTLSGGRDLHSVPGDPQLVDPAQFDYHLKTEQTLGRLQPDGQRTSDLVSSPLLDAGNPASSAWTNEPGANGGRINIGRYGGTTEASIALTTPWLRTVSFGDAGGVTNGVVPLIWTAGGGFSNQTVAVEVSVDGGKTWDTTVASGIPATNGMADWTVTGLPDTPAAAWRVVCLSATNISDRSTTFFSIRNQPLNLFVATADTNEAIYVTGPGLADNWMASSNAPINSLRTAFERYDLEPGDRIWVDTGTYAEDESIAIGVKNSGSATNPVRVIGNQRLPYRGTVLARVYRTVGSSVFQISRAGGVRMESMAISNAWSGVNVENSGKVTMERVRIGHCGTNAVYAGSGSDVDLSWAIIERNLSSGLQTVTGSVVKVRHCLFQENPRANVFFSGGTVDVKNSILEAAGASRSVYYLGGTGTLIANFNNIRATEGANVASGEGVAHRFLNDWQKASGNDVRSSGFDPLFVNPGAMDFHLKSQYGRYVLSTGGWTNDSETSRLIDLGDPTAEFVNEPANNGGRVNVGLYGNTLEASKSSGEGVLVPLTMSDGGTIRGEVNLYWSFLGIASNEIVKVQFSGDGGKTWTNIATNVYADVGLSGLPWSTTNFSSTAMGAWRVMTTHEPPIVGSTDTNILFAIKNEPLSYYVNDASTNGDVYCSDIGKSTNKGLEPETPIDSVSRLLGRYKVEPGDVVYVDTGLYRQTAPLVISVVSTSSTSRLIVQGSTNEAAGGSVFTNSNGAVIELRNSRSVELRDLRLHGGTPGLLLTQSSSNWIRRVRSVDSRGNAFELGIQSDQNQFIQCAALHFYKTGYHVASPVSPQIAPTTNYWISGVISPVAASSNGTAVSTGALVGVQSGRLYVSNSVFVAASPMHPIYSVASSSIRGNYNCYHRPFPDSLFAQISGDGRLFGVSGIRLAHLGAWVDWIQADSDSFSSDPLFADLPGGDLHPKSAGGRYVPADGAFVQDDETSPLIDAGDPAATYALESLPNGNRINVGIYGNDPLASRTSTNGTYVLMTLNDGGVVQGTNVMLKWLAQGAATSQVGTVYIQVLTNSGGTWQTIATNPSSSRQHVWNSTNFPAAYAARWRVRHGQNPAWDTISDRDILIHNTNMTYYVNDASTNGDVYCSTTGAVQNTGFSPQSPLPSLADVLSKCDLEPGDMVKIDTGVYIPSAPIEIGYLDCGTAIEPVTIQGSTNRFGSVFQGNGFLIENARGVTVKNLKLVTSASARTAATVGQSEDITLDQVDVFGAFWNGVSVVSSSNVFLHNFTVEGALTNGVSSVASFNTRLEFGVLWSNRAAQVLIENQLPIYNAGRDASYVTVSNCVLGAFGIRNPAYQINGTLRANYNNFYLTRGALAALSFETGFGREFDSVGSWSIATNMDAQSLSHDPRFADVLARDFHLKSSGGRFDPTTETVVQDPASEDSPLIDAGAPSIFCTEAQPNGGRVNIGRYGNTSQASLTPTNASLTLISFNDGGRASGTNALVTWLARGSATNAGVTVTISFSDDGGATWTMLTNGISAASGSWTWNTTYSLPTMQGKLKIEANVPGGATAVSDKLFSVRNQPFNFYVNDGSTNNDVYCSNKGNDANSGLSNNAPMASLNKLLERYDLESGDTVFIDTGLYRDPDPWRITQADSAGNLGLPPVVFQGSTNSLLGGTVLDRQGQSVGIQVDYAVGVRLRNLTVSNTLGSSAVIFNECQDVAAEQVVVRNGNIGFLLNKGGQLRVANSLVLDSYQGVVISALAYNTNIVYPVIENNVIWETAGPAIRMRGGRVTARNNILSVKVGHYVYDLGGEDVLYTDYNAICGGRVFRQEQNYNISPMPIIYETVGAWAAASTNDLHSYDGDPLLVNPAVYDFHLKSTAGRYDGGLSSWTNDAISSPLIDAGWPESTAWTNEPFPRGDRVNIGLYGGTPWASKSSTNSTLHLLTLNRGGVASGQVALNWKAAGAATGHTVRVEASIDDGQTWFRIAEGQAASSGGILWNSSSQRSPLARWRVQDEQETNVAATSELNFVLHNGPIHYYVNDDGPLTNDVYCSAMGNSTNTGALPSSPKRWVSEILETYNLEPGDMIHVDTGNYQSPHATVIGDLDAGSPSQDPLQQVTIQGSTNELAGGSLFIMSDPSATAFELRSTCGIRFDRIRIQNAQNGLLVSTSFFVAAQWLNIRGCVNGANIQSSSNIALSHSTLAGNQNAGIYFRGAQKESLSVNASVFWANRYGIHLEQGYAFVSNSILGMVLPHSFGYYIQKDKPQTEVQGDYNGLYVQHSEGAVAGWKTGSESSARTTVFENVSTWIKTSGQDAHSLGHNPQLADPDRFDFHLKSVGGRYRLGTGWVSNDTVSSPMIDSANPRSMAWTAEPDPNGRRLNIGLYGGTAEASKTPSNGYIICLYPSEGARVSGIVTMRWAAVSAATNYAVRIDYSPNDRSSWTNIAYGPSAGEESFEWDSGLFGKSAQAWWRITCIQDEAITDNAGSFVLDGSGSIGYYVNDASTLGDVYCTAPGDDANDGLTPAKPKATLQALLDAYSLAPSDVVFVDAGTYKPGAPIKIDPSDSGFVLNGTNMYVTIQGSTNPAAATVFESPSVQAQSVFLLSYAINVRLKDLTIRGAKNGVEAIQTIGCELDGVRIENNRLAGINLSQSSGFRLLRSTLRNNGSIGTDGVAVMLNTSSLTVENSVLWKSPSAIAGLGTLTVTNSVLDADGPNGRIYRFPAGGLSGFRGDYNCYSRKNGALIAEQAKTVGGNDYYNDIPQWSAVSSSDEHSMTISASSVSNVFANADDGDFHPLSTRGRFVAGGWTNDAILSPLVDAGAPEWAFDQEPDPNGGRINIGVHGNTTQASMTQTNPPWLRAIALNEGGVVSSNVLLYWTHGGMPDTTLVRLEYSDDYESTWTTIASNIVVGSRARIWDISSMPLSLGVYWRVICQDIANVSDRCDFPFAIKSKNYDFYVNDSSTNGDLWCMAVGQEWNTGTNPASPKNSINALLANYPVGGGDRIFIDTGEYSESRILLDSVNTGLSTNKPLKILGSTNVLKGGAFFRGNGATDAFKIQNVHYIEMENIRISGARNGIALENAEGIRISGVELFSNQVNGVWVSGCSDVELKNSRLWNNKEYGYFSTGQKGPESILNATFYGNQLGAANIAQGQLSINNSILIMTNLFPIYTETGVGSIGGDFNLLGRLADGLIASNLQNKIAFNNLREWQTAGRDWHSLTMMDPLFVNPGTGDFHLLSSQSYMSNGVWVSSSSNSWAIDMGNPASSVGAEPSPNGGRINIGAYGGTAAASRTDTNSPALLPVSLRDGGVAPDGQHLYWLYRGIQPTNTVRLEYSPDNGLNWEIIGSAISIDDLDYRWSQAWESSPLALWKVVLESDPSINGVVPAPFIYRPQPLTYYVNDAFTNNDVYCTAPGDSNNLGYTANSPLDSVQAVMDKYKLLGGDEVKVDTGVYTLSEPIEITAKHRGSEENRVKFTGSTNRLAGGSRLEPAIGMKEPAFLFLTASYVDVSWFHVLGFTNGVSFEGATVGSSKCRLMDFDIQGSDGPGVNLSKSTDIQLRRVLIREGLTNGIAVGQSSVELDACILWSNRSSSISFGKGAGLSMTNSVLESSGLGNFCYLSSTSAAIRADYNLLFIHDGAQLASIDNKQYEKLPQWVAGMAQDAHSLSTDPLFHDPEQGDFHPRSVAGRYQPGHGWTNDLSNPGTNDFSPLIDMGSPRTAWSNEPIPNGSRRNIGLHGNTPQASKSNTNRWLKAVTGMSGGILKGGFNLVWGYGGGINSNETVQLWYSFDNGMEDWKLIHELAVGASEHWWQSDVLQANLDFIYATSPAGRWKILLRDNTNVWNMAGPFGLRNEPFSYYINDASTNNDVYTTGIGKNENMGFFPAAPMLTLQNLLEEVDLEPEDRVYIDTGLYPMADTNRPIVWPVSDGGEKGEAVIVRGSYHPDGSRFVASNRFVAGAFFIMEASHVDVQNVEFEGESVEFRGEGLVVSNLVLTNGNLKVLSNSSLFENIQIDRGVFSLSGKSNWVKRLLQRWGETDIIGNNMTMQNSAIFTTNQMKTGVVVKATGVVISNCTVFSANGSAIGNQSSGILRLGHNILVAGGPDPSSVIAWEDGGLISDWNNLWAKGLTTWVGSRNGRWEKLAYWQVASGQDANSFSFEPLFQNEMSGDFHLNSRGGRWSPFHNDWKIDVDHSPLIDLGDPGIWVGTEPTPNGGRRNLGAYGGDANASKSRPDFWLTALTQNDGGVLKGSNVVLRWAAGNSSGKTITLRYSADGGTTWSNVATGLTAGYGDGYRWDTTGFPDSFNARWQVLAEDGSGVSDMTDAPFSLRNGTQAFYVNDNDLVGDIYCSATGSVANTGLAPNSPRLTLQSILDDYDLEGGDTVYVDTGTYVSTSDVRIIWSRSGSTNADVVIQGNTNNAYGTRLLRAGITNHPAVGINVKASQIRLAHLAVQGADRSILLESTRNASVQGVVAKDGTTGISVESAQGTDIRNSGFWNVGWGVSLSNTRTSVLENLTFEHPSWAGIRLNNTLGDTLQNNIFVLGENAYAYSVGTATSLLQVATMDYNLYDFDTNLESGFYEGATNNLRRWHLAMNRDYRSAITNAHLADLDANFDFQFHPKSEQGRWTPNGWTLDGVTSWAVDHGRPDQDYGLEPTNHGERLNIGMYGNTLQASKGNTQTNFECRTLNDGGRIYISDPLWPLVWSTHLLDSNDRVEIQFSNDGGLNWLVLTNVPAYQEYYLFTADNSYLTAKGLWKVVSTDNPSVSDINDRNFFITGGDLRFLTSPKPVSGLLRCNWSGGVGGFRYRIEYSDDFGKTWNQWDPKFNGPASINKSNFMIPAGETALSYVFEDRTSYLKPTRWYRIWELQD